MGQFLYVVEGELKQGSLQWKSAKDCLPKKRSVSTI